MEVTIASKIWRFKTSPKACTYAPLQQSNNFLIHKWLLVHTKQAPHYPNGNCRCFGTKIAKFFLYESAAFESNKIFSSRLHYMRKFELGHSHLASSRKIVEHPSTLLSRSSQCILGCLLESIKHLLFVLYLFYSLMNYTVDSL